MVLGGCGERPGSAIYHRGRFVRDFSNGCNTQWLMGERSWAFDDHRAWIFEGTIDHATLLRTDDGGRTWRQIRGPTFKDVTFVDASRGVALVEAGFGDTFCSPMLSMTADGGDTWTAPVRLAIVDHSELDQPLCRLHSDRGGAIWASDFSAWFRFRSVDGGSTWTETRAVKIALAFGGNAVPAGRGRWWISSLDRTRPTLARSDDSGRSWMAISTGVDGAAIQLIAAEGDQVWAWLFTDENDASITIFSRDAGRTWVSTVSGAT